MHRLDNAGAFEMPKRRRNVAVQKTPVLKKVFLSDARRRLNSKWGPVKLS